MCRFQAVTAIGRVVDPQPAGMFLVLRVADTHDQLLIAVAIKIGPPYCVAPQQLVVEHVPRPQAPGVGSVFFGAFRPSVHHDLKAVPRLDGCQIILRRQPACRA